MIDFLVILDDVGDHHLPWSTHFAPRQRPVTPFLSLLAGAGRVFDRFYTQPLCSPTRASLWTCSLPLEHGVGGSVHPNEDFELARHSDTWVRRLRAAGVPVGLFGKHHLCGEPKDPTTHPTDLGFSYWEGTPHNLEDYFAYYWVTNPGTSPPWTTRRTRYHTLAVAEAAGRWLLGAADAVCVLAFQAAHDPYHAVPDHLCSTPDDGTEESRMLRSVEAVDFALRDLWNSLEDWQQELVRWWVVSDNGDPLFPPAPGEGKGSTSEHATNGTLLLSRNGFDPGRTNALVSVCDLGQTILALRGEDGVPDVYGQEIPAGTFQDPGSLAGVRQFVTAQRFHQDDLALPVLASAVGMLYKLRARRGTSPKEEWFLAPGDHTEIEVSESEVPPEIREELRREAWRVA